MPINSHSSSITSSDPTSSLAPPPTDPITTPTPTSKYLDFPPLDPLPPTHSIRVATLRLAAHSSTPLNLYTSFALHAAASLGIPTSRAAALPTTASLFTVIKSPFVHKKAQENFRRREHRRAVAVYDAGEGSLDLWMRYLKRHAIGGVGMRMEVHEWVGWGEVQRAAGGKGLGQGKGKGSVRDEVERKAEAVRGEAEKAGKA